MSTRAGYMITLEHLREFHRLRHPEVSMDDSFVPPGFPVYEIIRKYKLYKFFDIGPVVLPGKPEMIWDQEKTTINPNYSAIMFTRRLEVEDLEVWLPPRVRPGKFDDLRAGDLLRKCGLVVSEWVVLYTPEGNLLAAKYVCDPNGYDSDTTMVGRSEGTVVPNP
ncbi:hypothetical protein RhiXN_07962 [Rhizoctonia solani]|uniref:Uncharacterized protein n=1 Tax=Rhizoctonia solani TaxID=456999 RepID=A0A8H8P2V3_9AGAM|nr:uncharacterized protein RhiXN_07962 [Rhizoctonia solani]QRW22926.1 hypothetical protein RhiXN_07962 [Rhizoctonia solani]